MATRDATGSGQYAIHLVRSDIARTDDGNFLLPVLLEDEGQQTRGCLSIGLDEAARLHAQLDRFLSGGWAMTETSKVATQCGELYPVNGSGHLR